MQAEFAWRRVARALVAVMIAACFVAAGPATTKAHAAPGPGWLNPCNSPGGKWVCDKAADGAKWVYDASGADVVVEAVDFGSDPLGYLEQKVRSGTKGMFAAFGEELTGKKSAGTGEDKKERGD